MADLNNVTGLFSGNWYPSNASWCSDRGAAAVADDDNNMTTIPAALNNYIVDTGNTYNLTLADLTTVAQGNILIENTAATGCNAPASSTYDFDRTVVLNMTEAVNPPADLAAFKATSAACGQTNVCIR